MPSFSIKSTKALATTDAQLQDLFYEVIKHFDCSVLEGHRNKERQNKLWFEKKTEVKWPLSNHNSRPSKAADVVPYPVGWGTSWEAAYEKQMIFFAGFVLGIAADMGICIRWGGDWNKDWKLRDNRFNDYPHFELL